MQRIRQSSLALNLNFWMTRTWFKVRLTTEAKTQIFGQTCGDMGHRIGIVPAGQYRGQGIEHEMALKLGFKAVELNRPQSSFRLRSSNFCSTSIVSLKEAKEGRTHDYKHQEPTHIQ